ncbi:hypothetical protein D3C80_1057400 [compost metagenome]
MQTTPDSPHQVDQGAVTPRVTVAIIDRLEVVQIHNDQRQWLTKTPGTFTFLLQDFFQAIAVGDQGQGITFSQVAILVQLTLQLLIDPRQFTRTLGDQRLE